MATAVKARVLNNGQSCIAAKRFIVHEQIAEKFEKEFVTRMQALKLGDPFDEKTDIGPLATPGRGERSGRRCSKIAPSGRQIVDGGKPVMVPGIST